MSGHVLEPRDACSALELMFWSGPVVPARMWTPGEESTLWYDRGSDRRLWQLLERLEHRYSAEVHLGLPRPRAGHGTASAVTVLWAVTDGKAQAEKLRGFKPAPTIVLREGSSSRYVALWSLRKELGWEDAVRANKRIAHAVGAKKKHADPDTFEFPAPGSVLRRDRSRPCVVSVAACDLGRVYGAGQVVKRLKDAPDPDGWLKRQRGAA